MFIPTKSRGWKKIWGQALRWALSLAWAVTWLPRSWVSTALSSALCNSVACLLSSLCCRFNTTVEIGTTENYAYHFRVCREVNSSLHDFAGLVQMDRQSGKTTVIGRINETQVFNGSKTTQHPSYFVSSFCLLVWICSLYSFSLHRWLDHADL